MFHTGDPSPQLRQTIKETLEIIDQLHADKPGVSADVLADRMGALSLNLLDLGMTEEMIAVLTFAVILSRQVANNEPTKRLAAYLHNLGLALGKIGRRDEALASVEEAVAIYQKLSADSAYFKLTSLSL